jgi:membrane protease subunit (stomatin/prohibitin family)
MAECMPLNRLEAPMSLQDALRSQLIEIIEWTDDSRETLSYRFPDQDKEIKRGAKLIVRESQAAQFVYLGQFGDLFRPGQRTNEVLFIFVMSVEQSKKRSAADGADYANCPSANLGHPRLKWYRQPLS